MADPTVATKAVTSRLFDLKQLSYVSTAATEDRAPLVGALYIIVQQLFNSPPSQFITQKVNLEACYKISRDHYWMHAPPVRHYDL
ncbi:hypothetical protein ABW20_dc0107455 [Dactylellina cionopaga]|nr:hypothetical protein ABW20_dc0107455 [Dactylellina cionopaga]